MKKDTTYRRIIYMAMGSLITLFLIGVPGVIFIYSGLYDIAARTPHLKIVQTVLTLTKTRSIRVQARDLEVPDLKNIEKIKRGFELYQKKCVVCHGAPGEARSTVGRGLNPNPPPLEKAAENWSAGEISWIIANGLKMAGMPGYALGESEEDIWAMTAFVLKLNNLNPTQYESMKIDFESGFKKTNPNLWKLELREEKINFSQGSINQGKKLLSSYGCTSCHFIPGISFAHSNVGPPLDAWAQRHYISGQLVNTPQNLIYWIQSPQSVDAESLMPNLGVSKKEASSMAAYLFSLSE